MPQKTVTLVKSTLVPDVSAARGVIKALRKSVKTDAALKAALLKNPRAVLADRGLPREYQNEFLAEMGKKVSAAAECGCTGCCATSSFCCETV
jgi:hypothetical protein